MYLSVKETLFKRSLFGEVVRKQSFLVEIQIKSL